MSGFFLEDKPRSGKRGAGKRKRGSKSKEPSSRKTKTTRKERRFQDSDDDADIVSDASSDNEGGVEYEEGEEEEETAQEKRLRLAKKYLAELQQEEKENADGEEVDQDAITHRLKQDVLEQSGRLQKAEADSYIGFDQDNILTLRGHRLSLTCSCISPDDKHVFTGSKDSSIIKWDVKSGLKVGKIHGSHEHNPTKNKCHTGHILALAISSDGKFLASGGHDKSVLIWNAGSLEHVHTFRGHRDTVSGLSFRKGSHQLFSTSCDRSVKIWNLDEMAYVETLFGHQDALTGIDSMYRDRAVTSGGRDRSVRMWKVPEESQLVFNATGGSVDCIVLMNEEFFVTGSDNGSLGIWNINKKKPVFMLPDAHKKTESEDRSLIPDESWITALTSLRNSDLLASAGSCDGCIRLWKCGEGFKSVSPLLTIPVEGFVNSLQFSSDGNYLLAAVGQEHRLGRWWRLKHAKNSLLVIPLSKKTDG